MPRPPSPNGQFAIDLHDVDKTYRGKVHALRGIEMQVHHGEVFGLLGPNGAGKSTLVKIMMTVVRANRASGTLLGQPVGSKRALARVGYLPEHHRMPKYLTGRQALDYYAALAHVPKAARKRRAEELLDIVGMSEWGNRKIGSYSKGMQQRIGVAQALMNEPDLVVLDEPTDGVDPVGRRDIRDILKRLKSEGKTVFLNSHLLSELEMVCDRVAILVQGEVVKQGTIHELTVESERYEICIEGGAPEWAAREDAIRTEPAGEDASLLVMPGAEPGGVQPVIDRLRGEGRTIVSVRPRRETLEDLFMRAVTDPTTGEVKRPGAKGDAG
ncbi:MAG: ABC transporter ATP-binding protein [Planctomycetes bacterium]|nr:ABC transporter ATP-binding protein [Planctomycetota bacterium]